MRSRLTAAAAGVLLVTVLASCSEGADGGASPATDTTTAAPATTAPAVDLGKQAERELKAALGVKRFTRLCGVNEWACYIAGMEAKGGALVVTMQTTDRDLGDRATRAIFTLINPDTARQFSSVQAVSQAGGQIGMTLRSSVTLLD